MKYPLQHEDLQVETGASRMSMSDAVCQRRKTDCSHSGMRTETVLVVDDDEMVRCLVRTHLEGCGLVVEEASNATEALRKADTLKESLSVLVTDVVMPGTSGAELAYTLGRRHFEVPVVFMSGYAAGGQLDKLFQRATFLQKPFSRTTLVNAVRAGLSASAKKLDVGITVQ